LDWSWFTRYDESIKLMVKVKLTDFGAAPPRAGMSKEDERSLEFAERAQRGDYDDGLSAHPVLVQI
tara:strand:+ start:348 stop:545 length:198 start_codon:yes stop_codon:yes gene_type:complete